jgi:cytoskeletal protein RodZ
MVRKSKKFRITKKLTLLSGTAVVIVIAIGLGFWHYHTRNRQVTLPVAPATNTVPSSNASNNSATNTSNTTSTPDKTTPPAGGYTSSSSSGPNNGSGQPPQTPTGPFVSNHGSNVSASSENSVCNTTPGATCYIEFTNGNSTLQLETGTANSNGAVFWQNWNVASYDFSPGQWTITAVANLNGQTATAKDGTPLTIK